MNKKTKPFTDKDGEVRDLTDEELQSFRPINEVAPELLAKIKRGVGERGKQKAAKKVAISIRINPEVDEYFRGTGAGWQGRINEVLANYVVKANKKMV